MDILEKRFNLLLLEYVDCFRFLTSKTVLTQYVLCLVSLYDLNV